MEIKLTPKEMTEILQKVGMITPAQHVVGLGKSYGKKPSINAVIEPIEAPQQ